MGSVHVSKTLDIHGHYCDANFSKDIDMQIATRIKIKIFCKFPNGTKWGRGFEVEWGFPFPCPMTFKTPYAAGYFQRSDCVLVLILRQPFHSVHATVSTNYPDIGDEQVSMLEDALFTDAGA